VLRRTFLHVAGIGRQTERKLWESGCSSWDDALANPNLFSFGRADRAAVMQALRRSQQALDSREHQFFTRGLGLRDAWRVFPEFRDTILYLDIETDGPHVTVIGLYDGSSYQALARGVDLGNFADILSRYSVIVTFAGAMFDVPQLKRAFRNLLVDQIHIDLCPTLRDIGVRGGLKKVEKLAGILRPDEVEGLNGYDAVRLWRRWDNLGDEASLRRLIAYNREDVVNLERLMEWAYPQLVEAAVAGQAGRGKSVQSAG